MCVHSTSFDGLVLTKEERLLEMRVVRERHRALYRAYADDLPGGVQAWKDHLESHKDAARRLRDGHYK